MFKLDQQEFIKFRVNFQDRITAIAEEIVAQAMDVDGDWNCSLDWDSLRETARDMVHPEADREVIYTADNYKTVQFMQQWFCEEVDEAEQRFEDYGMTFQGLDHYMSALAYFIWESHIDAAVTNRIDELQQGAEEAA